VAEGPGLAERLGMIGLAVCVGLAALLVYLLFMASANPLGIHVIYVEPVARWVEPLGLSVFVMLGVLGVVVYAKRIIEGR